MVMENRSEWIDDKMRPKPAVVDSETEIIVPQNIDAATIDNGNEEPQ
jgi:hypothetical protein